MRYKLLYNHLLFKSKSEHYPDSAIPDNIPDKTLAYFIDIPFPL